MTRGGDRPLGRRRGPCSRGGPPAVPTPRTARCVDHDAPLIYVDDMAHSIESKRITPEGAAALVKSGDWVDYGFGTGQPDLFDRALAARRNELTGVKIRTCLTVKPRAVLDVDPNGDHFLVFNWHFSGYDRKQHDVGR